MSSHLNAVKQSINMDIMKQIQNINFDVSFEEIKLKINLLEIPVELIDEYLMKNLNDSNGKKLCFSETTIQRFLWSKIKHFNNNEYYCDNNKCYVDKAFCLYETIGNILKDKQNKLLKHSTIINISDVNNVKINYKLISYKTLGMNKYSKIYKNNYNFKEVNVENYVITNIIVENENFIIEAIKDNNEFEFYFPKNTKIKYYEKNI